MSSNPNLQKIGKRKNAAPKQQADWLFPSTEKNASTSAPKAQTHARSTNKQDKQLAKDLLKRRADGTSNAEPPSQLMAIVSTFLSENEFDATAAALQTERRVSGINGGDAQDIPSLTTIYNEWLTLKAQSSIPDANAKLEENGKASKNIKQARGEKKKTKAQESGSDVEMVDAPLKKISAKRPSSSSSSPSSSSSDSDADDEKEIPVVKASPPKSKPKTLKRKAASSSSESPTSDSDSSSEDEAPRSKKMKMKASSPSSSESSESSDEEASEAIEIASSTSGSESSSSDSSSSDSESSESGASTNLLAQKTPLPASSDSDPSSSSSSNSSMSDSDSDSDSSSASSKKITSESSGTLSDNAKKASSSSEPSSDDSSSSSNTDAEPKQAKVIKSTTSARKLLPPLPPNPVAKKKPFKKTNVPFSRIPSDIKVDERLASNAYVPYDYAQKAHEDLIVTRGKGFTKEKNKKKRGSYRGGYIDVEGKKGIKFED